MRYQVLCCIFCVILNTCMVNSTAYNFVSGPVPLWLTVEEETSQFRKDWMHAFADLKIIAYSYFIDQDIASCDTLEPATTVENYSPVNLTLAHKKKLLDLHNLYRSNVNPSSSNMECVVWDEDIERAAQSWADKCEVKYNYAQQSTGEFYGQNLDQQFFPYPELSANEWYEERHGYTYSDQSCSGQRCPIYESMINARISRMGCGRNLCGHFWYNVCYYDQTNYVGKRPYNSGIPCSACQHKGSKCYMNLCISPEVCAANPDICEKAVCNLKCQNCGKLDMEKCECQCADGWEGADCTIPCVDKDERCGPILFTESCFNTRFEFHMSKYCRKLCKYCIGADPTSNNLCCGGKMCDKGYVLNNECECEVYPPA